MNISERIFYLLSRDNKTASELGEYIGVKPSSINGWKKGSYPSSKYIEKIAEFFKVSISYLISGHEETTLGIPNQSKVDVFYSLNKSNLDKAISYAEFLQCKEEKEKAHLHLVAEEDVPYSTTKNIVPIGHIKEETDSAKEKELHILGYTAAGEPIDMPNDTYGLEDVIKVPADTKADFALTVKGDSMEPRIPNESVVYVKKQDTVDNGQIAIVSINNTVTCKIFKQKNDIIYLHSINPNYDPIVIDNEDIDFKIIGKVINPK
ncbi:MAG: helix-turn-helix domain-containing protein [Filifactor alocis]|uniref:helix-turn-helix domain-containing protein n=1 Tax=Filifactor alocis TaxID=143361 RepID=UPI003F9ED054